MKTDVTEFYNASLSQEHYTHKSDYIRHHLEEKYGTSNIYFRSLFFNNNI